MDAHESRGEDRAKMPEEEMPRIVVPAESLCAEDRQGTRGQQREPSGPSRTQGRRSAEHEQDGKRRRERQTSHPPDARPSIHRIRSARGRVIPMADGDEKSPEEQSQERQHSSACAAFGAGDAEMERAPCREDEDQDEQDALAQIHRVANLQGQIGSRSQNVGADRHAQQRKASPQERAPLDAAEPPDWLQVPGERLDDLVAAHKPASRINLRRLLYPRWAVTLTEDCERPVLREISATESPSNFSNWMISRCFSERRAR